MINLRLLVIISVILCFFSNCKEPVKTKEYFLPEVGLTITAPADLVPLDSLQIKSLNEKGIKAFENTYDTVLDFSQTKTLLCLQKGKLNNFSVTITPFDPATDGSWIETNNQLKQNLMETFSSQVPDVKIDTSSSVQLVNGLNFEAFHMKVVFSKKMILRSTIYSKLYKNNDIGITLTYVDDKMEGQFKKMIATAKFNR